jgi:hypothetical protein
MPTLDKKQENDSSNQATKLQNALFEKRVSIAEAIDAAPEGRHQRERESLEDALRALTARVDGVERDKLDAFCDQQRGRLEQVQRAELELGKLAVESAGSLESLSQAVDAIGGLHDNEHARLAEERSALEAAAAVDDPVQRTDVINAALANMAEDSRLDTAFRERPGMPWTAAEIDARLSAGAIGEVTATREEGDMKRAPSSNDEADNDARHKRGNFGERTAAEALAAMGYSILDYKPDIGGTTRPGIDIVAMKRDEQNRDMLYLIDNKALSRDGNVNSVSALTSSLEDTKEREGNLTRVRRALEEMADEATRSAQQVEIARRALAAMDDGRIALAVTNANLARDERILEDVSDRLKKQHDVEFIDVMRGKAQAADKAVAKTEEEGT